VVAARGCAGVTFDQPLWLLLLSAVPVLWWLHRRISAPRVTVVASVAALRGALAETSGDRPRRRLDPELLLLLSAAVCLALAAAEPRFATDSAAVLVVVDTSPSGDRLGTDGAALRQSALLQVQRVLAASGDDVLVELFELGSRGPPTARRVSDMARDLPWDVREPGELAPPDDLPRSLAPALAYARSRGHAGVLLVTDRDVTGGAGVVICGPESAPASDGGVAGVVLDGDEVSISVLRTRDGPSIVRIVMESGAHEVAVPPLDDEASDPIAVVRAPAPPRGERATYSISSGDALSANDERIVARVGGVRRVRLSGPAAQSAESVRRLLASLRIEVRDDPLSEVDVEIVVGGPPVAPRGSEPPRLQLATAPGTDALIDVREAPTSARGARISTSGVLADAAPAPSTSMVTTGRIDVAADAVRGAWRDGSGLIAVALPRRVVVALDPDAAASSWSRDPSFPVLLLASFDHLTGGVDRLETIRGLPLSESVRAGPPPRPAGREEILALVRPGAPDPRAPSYGSALAACGACLLAAAAGVSIRRAQRFSGRAGASRTAG